MIPTMKLRFVERVVTSLEVQPGVFACSTARILQQWWEDRTCDVYPTPGKWQDVPVEKDNPNG